MRYRVLVAGVVQGVGFRPFIWKHARKFQVTGWVKNDSIGVTIEIQGDPDQLKRFIDALAANAPPLATIDQIEFCEVAALDDDSTFVILQSATRGPSSTPVSPEISVCDDCLKEMRDPDDRRYRYPFINCTNCGPRFTIVEDIPYDRPLTTMKSFPMCERCRVEFEDPSDRRFHAQPIACPDCGPRIWIVAAGDARRGRNVAQPVDSRVREDALTAFQDAIRAGKIVAVKGIGGFHLACDATSRLAIAELRTRKGRIDKPFAVMARDVQQARAFAVINEHEEALLQSRERPIVLLSRKTDFVEEAGAPCLPSISPGNDFVGVMLPYSPLHFLLMENSSPLVFTSGNLTDEPIVRENIEASERLGGIADAFLMHDRGIHVVCDDSVVRCVGDAVLPIRRSRGYAPMPVRLNREWEIRSGTVRKDRCVLAIGGEIKATFCATQGDYAYMSQHIGDMGNLETLQAMEHSVDHFLRLFRIDPEAIVADLHPGYLSASWAKEFAKRRGVAFLRVQHHHAHVAALMAEHGMPGDEPMIGVCFDGTGFGTDRAIWGGEFLVADARSFDRFAHLGYVPLPGGDAAIKQPWRVALAHLFAADIRWRAYSNSFFQADRCHDNEIVCPGANELKLVQQQLEKNIHCIPTSSMGRFFDAMASLIGIRHSINYEAQAAMEMEALASRVITDARSIDARYHFRFVKNEPVEIDPKPLLVAICKDLDSGVAKPLMAARFHHAVAQLVVDVCESARDRHSINRVGLTGGVFQNVLLLKLTTQRLAASNFEVFIHQRVPPNDGGIALGQAFIGRATLTLMESPRSE